MGNRVGASEINGVYQHLEDGLLFLLCKRNCFHYPVKLRENPYVIAGRRDQGCIQQQIDDLRGELFAPFPFQVAEERFPCGF